MGGWRADALSESLGYFAYPCLKRYLLFFFYYCDAATASNGLKLNGFIVSGGGELVKYKKNHYLIQNGERSEPEIFLHSIYLGIFKTYLGTYLRVSDLFHLPLKL